MQLVIGNPLGWWALLGIPLIVLIHFLQRRAKQETISTLFLLDRMRRESVSGRTFDRVRTSVPLWMQLLGVLLLTWLLINPRWEQRQVVQRVAVILDASVSMDLAKDAAREVLKGELEAYQRQAETLEVVLIESDLRNQNLYVGTSIDACLAALDAWEPRSGTHSLEPALRAAESLVGSEGALLLITDHQLEENPYEARVIAVGRSRVNVGLAGMSVEESEGEMIWKALARNYSKETHTRRWWIEVGADKTEPVEITLAPNESLALSGVFPEGVDRCVVALESDAFALDDRLPIVRPLAKPLILANFGKGIHNDLVNETLSAFSDIEWLNDGGQRDVSIWAIDPAESNETDGAGIVSIADPLPVGGFIQGRIVVENHPLVDDLNWQTLLCRESVELPRKDGDIVLVWSGDRAMIWFRPQNKQLHVNFDLSRSNATRLPAFIVLIHRYLEDIRADKIAFQRRNDELGQSIPLAWRRSGERLQMQYIALDGEEVSLTSDSMASLRLPSDPGFYEVYQGDVRLLEGAVHFADTREADFRQASSGTSGARSGEARESVVSGSTDAPWRVVLLLLGVVFLISWKFTGERATPASDFAK